MYQLSVVIAAKNASKTIEATLQSVESLQNYIPTEIIVVDDYSSDDTFSKCTTFANVKCLKNPDPCGAAYARNFGVRCSSSELICVLDSDDLIVPSVILLSVKRLQSLSHIDLIFGKRIDFEIKGRNSIKIYRMFPKKFDISTIQSWFAHFSNPITHSGTIFRKKWFNRVGGYNVSMKYAYDFDLWRRGFSGNNYQFSNEIVCYYRTSDIGLGGTRHFEYWKREYLSSRNSNIKTLTSGSATLFVRYSIYTIVTLLKYFYFIVFDRQLIQHAKIFIDDNSASLSE